MLLQQQLADIIDTQRLDLRTIDNKLIRESLPNIPVVENFATIVTGIRRCGKSTLLQELLTRKYSDSIYLNFEDIRLSAFEASDFTRLHAEIVRRKTKVIFFDEIQLVRNWDTFIHQLLREQYQVFITGSNASLLSKELGTHLTGRHLSMEMFPFSYSEFITFKNLPDNSDSVLKYLTIGGMPEYVKHELSAILQSLIDDILVRDIAVRHAIKDVMSLKQLTVYLLSNIGVPVSASKLVGLFGLKAPSTILEYFSYLSDAYVVEFVPQFSNSLKAINRNPKKAYAIDTGLISTLSMSRTENFGRRFENLIYLHLRRSYKHIFYFLDLGECDFIVLENSHAVKAVQVCYNLDDTNFERELNGALSAAKHFNLPHATIVTMNQSDTLERDGKTIHIVPAHQFLTDHVALS